MRARSTTRNKANSVVEHFRKTRITQKRLETNVFGRALVSFGLILTVAAMLVVNMPESTIKSDLRGRAEPYLNAIGLVEEWGVFAPNPRAQVVYATGHIEYSDGTSSLWSFPIRPGLMAYSDYRWHKFEELVSADNEQALWQPFAEYLANHGSTPGKRPVRVSLVATWAQIKPPGTTPELGPWQQHTYYTMPVGGTK